MTKLFKLLKIGPRKPFSYSFGTKRETQTPQTPQTPETKTPETPVTRKTPVTYHHSIFFGTEWTRNGPFMYCKIKTCISNFLTIYIIRRLFSCRQLIIISSLIIVSDCNTFILVFLVFRSNWRKWHASPLLSVFSLNCSLISCKMTKSPQLNSILTFSKQLLRMTCCEATKERGWRGCHQARQQLISNQINFTFVCRDKEKIRKLCRQFLFQNF